MKRVVGFIIFFNISLIESVFAVGSISIVKPQNFPLDLKFVEHELFEKMQVKVVIVSEEIYKLTTLSSQDRKDHRVFSLVGNVDNTDYHIHLRQDPKSVLQFLKSNFPAISKIHLIARDRDSAYSLRARSVADSLGLELKIHQTTNDKLNETYLKTFDSIDPASELLWVTHKIDENVRFFMLEKSWKNKAILVANYTSYVKQGMLIGFGIEFETLEREIANIIISTLLNSRSKEVDKRIYLNNLFTGLNKISAKRSPHIKNRQKWAVFDKRF